MKKKKQEITDIFIERKKLTLGVILVSTFAMTYYSLFFIMLTIFGYYYRSVYDPSYIDEPLNRTFFMNFLLWLIIGSIVVSLLILLLKRKRFAKFLFMTFTAILVVYQLLTATDYVWSVYIIEIMMVLVIAPLKVFADFNKKIKDGINRTVEDNENK